MENHGTVDKLVGDSVMAFWNAPTEDADHVARACAAVLACRDRNRAINADFAREDWHQLHTRYGLHVGEAVVGNIGSAERMNYTVIGATVNLAARLEGLNNAYDTEVLVSGAVASRVADRFLFRAIDTVLPKGIKTAVTIFELRGARDGSAEAAAEAAFCDAWAACYQRYAERDWDAAFAAFTSFAARYPADKVAEIYLKRVTDYANDPPDTAWDAVAVFKTK
jgi:adenylate cyclase